MASLFFCGESGYGTTFFDMILSLAADPFGSPLDEESPWPDLISAVYIGLINMSLDLKCRR